MKAAGGLVVAPPSRHASGRNYTWELSSLPAEVPLADVPAWLLGLVAAGEDAYAGPERDHFPAGERHQRACGVAAHLARRGLSRRGIARSLAALNGVAWEPALGDGDLEGIASWAARRGGTPPPGPSGAGPWAGGAARVGADGTRRRVFVAPAARGAA